MGDSQRLSAAAEVEVWLRGGGRVVAASERAARAMAEDFHHARQAEGLTAWLAPEIESWHQFVQGAWVSKCRNDDRLVMNPAQEQALWMQIVAGSRHGKSLLEGPLQRVAKMAAEAHGLLCAYAPSLLKDGARSNWQQDAAAFSGWLTEFDRLCVSGKVVSAARLPLELIPLLEDSQTERPALLLVGFDRMQPAKEQLLAAWGAWKQLELSGAAERAVLYEVADEHSELSACALWCKKKLVKDRHARLMVVTQDLPARRGEFERAFFQQMGAGGSGPRVEFSLGVPLAQVPLVRAAHLLLRWLGGSIEEHELDWLLGCGQAVASAAETFALAGFMRALRRQGMERTQWRCDEFLKQRIGVELPASWVARMREAMRQLDQIGRGAQSPMAWAELVPELLQDAGWPGERALSSEEFQALRRWQHALDVCASLGFDGRRIKWNEFLKVLERTLAETLFAPESENASVVITGPAESAGLAADAIWFMGASEDAWPSKGSLHPLLPVGVQRDFKMPHATPQLDRDLARTVTARLLASALEVCISFARQIGGVEVRASRLAVLQAGEAQELPDDLAARVSMTPVVETVEDCSSVPLSMGRAAGGSAVLSAQSQCPFKAFALARLRAEGWAPAQAGLNALQRGELLHEVLHSVWGPQGVRSLAELKAIADLESFVKVHVQAVFEREMPAAVRTRMPEAYLALEEERLTRVVAEWLRFESTRADFTVTETEVKKESTIAGLSLNLRLDRIDRLNNGKLLVIDYKTGDVSTKTWQLPRPEDVQLPLYAGFALGEGNEPGGLVFAKVRTGKHEFAGFVENPVATLLPNGIERKALGKNSLTAEQLKGWREYIEEMARDFLAGRADVDPIDSSKTCKKCDFKTLCRIEEISVEGEEESGEEESDE